jgi:arylsulfatase A-like enzyme
LVEDLPFLEMDQVWKYAFDENFGTTPPRPLTDRAIEYGRTANPKRLVIHYMQPHLPPVSEEFDISLADDGVGWSGGNPWVMIESNERGSQKTFEAYKNNLSPVIEDVNMLLKNIAAEKVVVTADHGNFLGENGNWGHHKRYARDLAVRQVPWWELSANDERTHIPNDYDRKKGAVSRNDQLEALGYV